MATPYVTADGLRDYRADTRTDHRTSLIQRLIDLFHDMRQR